MPNYAGAVALHKRSVKSLIHSSNVSLNIRLVVPRVSTGVNPLFGDQSRETNKTGTLKGPYSCLWYDALSAKTFTDNSGSGVERVVEMSAGQFRDATAFAELWLDDILIDINDPGGQTWLDKAQDVVSGGRLYIVLGYAKLGLSTSAPYSVIVGLKGGLLYDDK